MHADAQEETHRRGVRAVDGCLLLLLASLAGAASLRASGAMVPAFLDWSAMSSWFGSDVPRVFGNLVSRSSNHYRTEVHPLFSILTHPPVYVLRHGLGLDRVLAVRLFVAAGAALWAASLFVLLRLAGCRRPDAVLFTLVGATSAASVFWLTVPESYALGSVSLLAALAVVACGRWRGAGWYVAASAATLSFTVTNWMTGLAAVAVEFPWRRALRITAAALGVVAILSVVQKAVYPSAGLMLQTRSEVGYLFSPKAGGPLRVLRAATLHGMVMPTIGIEPRSERWWPRISVQRSPAGSASRWGRVGLAAWTGLLGLGLWALRASPARRELRWTLGLSILGQIGLHLVYGDETLLYTLHVVPLLVVAAALATLTRARGVALLLAAILVLCAGVNNVRQFRVAADFVAEQAGEPR